MLGIVADASRLRSQGVPKIFRAPMYRAHCAVIFAIAQLSCIFLYFVIVIIVFFRFYHHGGEQRCLKSNNLIKCWQIFKILALEHSAVHFQYGDHYRSTTPPTERVTEIIRPPVRSNGRSYKMLVMFFFFRQVPSAVPRPIAVKLCHMIGNWFD